MTTETVTDETVARAAQSRGSQRAGVLITLIAVVGAVAIMDIVAEMVVTLVKVKEEGGY